MKFLKTTVISVTLLIWALTSAFAAANQDASQTRLGYYRFPALHGKILVFTAEGDLWRVSAEGGIAQRLTSHQGIETNPAISPDGALVAFTAQYEGPSEVYTMPLDGGLPTRRTYDGGPTRVVGWTPDGRLLFSTGRYSTLPDIQLGIISLPAGKVDLIPLSQAAEGALGADGKTLFFTRLPFQGSYTKRYKGGTAQNIWKFKIGDSEALPLTAEYPGASMEPMWSAGRVYFVSDRDGIMNIWSMDETGGDLKQHTFHKEWDVKSPCLSDGRIAYQLGADIHILDIATGRDQAVPIQLASDFEQMSEKWVKKPFDFLTAVHLSPDGDRVVLTARGQVFVAPAAQGRTVRATLKDGVRYRQARFMPDGKHLLALSDESGEVEFWTIPANGIGSPEQVTSNGSILRFLGIPSPDGKLIAYSDKDAMLWIYDIDKKTHTRITTSGEGTVTDMAWSSDSHWLAYVDAAKNWFSQVMIYGIENHTIIPITTDRYDSYNPSWSPDGKWLYFLSDRNFVSLVTHPWTTRQMEPFFDRQTKIYAVSLIKDQRSPFRPDDELVKREADTAKSEKNKKDSLTTPKDSITVRIDSAGIGQRLIEVPVAAGNYSDLAVTGAHIYWITQETSAARTKTLTVMKIQNKDIKVDTIMGGVTGYEISLDRKKLLMRKDNSVFIFNADGAKPADLDKARINLDDWTFPLDPRLEWRQMFVEAWRLERDYFYDRKLHGVDWPGVRDKYLPLVDRITDRDELNDIFGEMIGELSALHMYVQGGDRRRGDDQIFPAALGAIITRDDDAGGYRIDHIYQSDPDEPGVRSPLADPDAKISEGDVITSINGVATLSVDHPGLLLRGQAGKQVLMEIRSPKSPAARSVIITPITTNEEYGLRYGEWEYTRRLEVEKMSNGEIGYVHLRAMNISDYAQWARDFYPVYLHKGLIIDVRHNNGGNVESWILEKLMRKAWAYWISRTGDPYSDMQYAFTGHVAVLCDEYTASDGELFVEGVRRLGLGKSIGTRTWGGEIWLSFGNGLVDNGIATAAESGVYGPEGEWLIEGHGVDPDIVVDNLPHATYGGKDAQLEAAIDYLKEQIKLRPVQVPPPPPYPDKSFRR